MALITVTAVTVFEIDTEKYIEAAQEEIGYTLEVDDVMEMNDSVSALAAYAVPDEEEELIPRWARDAMRLVSTSFQVE